MNHHHILPILSLILGSIAVASYPVQMISLPGAPSYPKFNLFSGYLNGSATAKPAPIFYVLAEAIRADPSTAPLVIWFNGGPGGSSLYGFFIENGPYRMSESGDTLTYDEFSGNQYANVLYLESPLGVGFSQNNQHGQTMNDFDTADINVHAIKDFMTRVHPNYAGRYYYLAGESYAGVYIPYLARSLLKERESGRMGERNFKFTKAMKLLNHGMMPSRLKDAVLRSWMEYRKGKPVNQTDLDNIRAANDEISENFLGWGPLGFNLNEHCYTQAVSSQQSTEEYHRPTDKTAIACYGERALEAYMNTADVQAALHVDKDFHGEKCPFRGQYFRESNVLPVYKDIFTLVNGSSFRVLVYSGDSDSVLPAMNGIQSTAQIAANNSLVDQGFDRAWAFYGDFAGMRSGYKNEHVSMDILTVRGAGHMVPMNLPAQAFQIINNFLFTYGSENVDYSAPIRKRGVVEASQSGLFTYNATIILAIIRILLFIVLAGAYSIHRLRRANICLDLNICDVFKRTKSTNLDNHVLDYRRLEDGSLLEITSSMSE